MGKKGIPFPFLGLFFLVFYALLAAPGYAQDRSRLTVYVPMPTGGTPGQRAYFQENFRMELVGANYPPVDTKPASLYTLLLDITDNPGFDGREPAVGDNQRYFLGLKLERSADNVEIISFNFPFNDTEAMASWNLYLLYQALANAYVPPEAAPPPVVVETPVDDRWRNQTLYLNVGMGADLGFFLHPANGDVETGIIMPIVYAGLEWHCMDFFSAEVDVKPRFMKNLGLTLTAALTARVVFKFSSIMMELYAGPEFTQGVTATVPPLWLIAGMQMGFRGAEKGAWVLDVGVTQNILGLFRAENTQDYNLLRFHLLAGFKFGFIDRKTKSNEPKVNEPQGRE